MQLAALETRMGKTQQAIASFNAGDLKTALKLASSFRIGITRAQSAVLKRGYECLVWPEQYRQLKKDPDQCVAEAKSVFLEVWPE